MSRYINADPVAIDHGAKQIYANHGDLETTTGQLRGFQKGELPGLWSGRAAGAQQMSFEGWDGSTRAALQRFWGHGENLGLAGRNLDTSELNVQQFVGSGDSTITNTLNPPTAQA